MCVGGGGGAACQVAANGQLTWIVIVRGQLARGTAVLDSLPNSRVYGQSGREWRGGYWD